MGCTGRAGLYSDQDAELFIRQEMERIEQSGVIAEYYSLNRGKNVDALYGEPDNDPLYGGTNPASPRGTPQTSDLSWNFSPDIAQGESELLIPCTVEYVEAENRNPMVRPEGKYVEYDAIMGIAIGHWECKVVDSEIEALQDRVPKEGDVGYIFGEWWDVVKVGKSGYVLGTTTAVGYRFELRKRSHFTPDRKIDM